MPADRFPFAPPVRPRSFALLLVMAVCFGSAAEFADAQRRDPYARARAYMVKRYLSGEGIKNSRVLTAMGRVPRHEFVRSRDRKMAYADLALPIGYQQTISPPFVVAYMTQVIDPQPTDRVLEIGTGSGYQAAVLAELAKEVYTIEIVDGLGRTAAPRLRRLGYDNVNCRIGDGYKGWAEAAPFDKIIVTCSPEKVPTPLVEQLREGGRMIIPLGERYEQTFHLLEKIDGELVRKELIPTLFVPMTGISEDNREILPDPSRPEITNGGFEIDENEDGLADGWHYQRLTELIPDNDAPNDRAMVFRNDTPGRFSQILQGTALDAREVSHIQFSIWAEARGTKAGPYRLMRPGVRIHFFDDVRREIGEALVGPWIGDHEGQKYEQTIEVPDRTREIIVQIGLNGGTGELTIDDVKLTPVEKEKSPGE